MNSIRQFLLFIILIGLGAANLSAQQFVNLIQNAGFNNDTTLWEFIVDENFEAAIIIGEGLNGTNALHTGFETRALQVLDLVEIGYDTVLLDKAPIIRFSYYVKGSGTNFGDQTRYLFRALDGDGNPIQEVLSDWIITTEDWQQVNYNLVNYGKNLRSISIEITCWDVESNVNANEGVILDAINLSINNHLVYTNSSTLDLAGWENVMNGGDGWNFSTGWVNSSFEWSSKPQTVNLMDLGYSAEALDSEPRIDLWEFILGLDGPGDGTGIADEHQLTAELRDAAGNVIVSYDSEVVFCTYAWQGVNTVFQNYGPGLREVFVEHRSRDAEF